MKEGPPPYLSSFRFFFFFLSFVSSSPGLPRFCFESCWLSLTVPCLIFVSMVSVLSTPFSWSFFLSFLFVPYFVYCGVFCFCLPLLISQLCVSSFVCLSLLMYLCSALVFSFSGVLCGLIVSFIYLSVFL